MPSAGRKVGREWAQMRVALPMLMSLTEYLEHSEYTIMFNIFVVRNMNKYPQEGSFS